MLVSAHRCGAGRERSLENSQRAVDQALDIGAEYVEFDVQRCADGTLVLSHDGSVRINGQRVRLENVTYPDAKRADGDQLVRYEAVLQQLHRRKRAHIDLKFTSPAQLYADPDRTYEVDAVKIAIQALGAENIVVTSLHDRSVKAVRDWAIQAGYPQLLVGLSLGSDFFPASRYRACGANLVVANHYLARLSAARFARRANLPLLVWTVDDHLSLRYWLQPGRAWMVTTNRPIAALDVRQRRVSV
ncbi:MAG: glycerophosphodiester phosphodiesterase [Marmoricola sp.]